MVRERSEKGRKLKITKIRMKKHVFGKMCNENKNKYKNNAPHAQSNAIPIKLL